MRLFSASIDAGGPFGRSAEDLAVVLMMRFKRPIPMTLSAPGVRWSRLPRNCPSGLDGLWIAVAGGYFQTQGTLRRSARSNARGVRARNLETR